MKKRLMLLLTLAVIVLTLAPAAMADHCTRCRTTTNGPQCWFAVTGGYPFCEVTTTGCKFYGTLCTGPHPVIDDDFGADYTVISVERLDEQPQPRADEPRVASLEAPPATR